MSNQNHWIAEACSVCDGKKIVSSPHIVLAEWKIYSNSLCEHCNGTGIEPVKEHSNE